MKKTGTAKKIRTGSVKKELKQVDAMFAAIANDKNLPTFVEHVLQCILLGTSEAVNLKVMYPKLHGTLNKWILAHNERIISLQKAQ